MAAGCADSAHQADDGEKARDASSFGALHDAEA